MTEENEKMKHEISIYLKAQSETKKNLQVHDSLWREITTKSREYES